MNASIRRKLSIAFTVYNRARAEARRRGDTKKIDALNKTLSRLVRNAYRFASYSLAAGGTKVLYITKNLCAINKLCWNDYLGARKKIAVRRLRLVGSPSASYKRLATGVFDFRSVTYDCQS